MGEDSSLIPGMTINKEAEIYPLPPLRGRKGIPDSFASIPSHLEGTAVDEAFSRIHGATDTGEPVSVPAESLQEASQKQPDKESYKQTPSRMSTQRAAYRATKRPGQIPGVMFLHIVSHVAQLLRCIPQASGRASPDAIKAFRHLIAHIPGLSTHPVFQRERLPGHGLCYIRHIFHHSPLPEHSASEPPVSFRKTDFIIFGFPMHHDNCPVIYAFGYLMKGLRPFIKYPNAYIKEKGARWVGIEPSGAPCGSSGKERERERGGFTLRISAAPLIPESSEYRNFPIKNILKP